MGTEFKAGSTGSSFDGARRESAYTDGDRTQLSASMDSTITIERRTA